MSITEGEHNSSDYIYKSEETVKYFKHMLWKCNKLFGCVLMAVLKNYNVSAIQYGKKKAKLLIIITS